jgi:uncharacterized protein (DUF849 family)
MDPMTDRIERMKACLNGQRGRREHPGVPMTPAELARSAAAAVALVARAGALGLPARIGLEDTLVGPDGQEAAGNAELVRLAIASWTTAAGAGRS